MSTIYMTETEQIEILKAWWKRYHSVVITVVTLFLCVVSGVRYWHWHQQKATEQASNAYEHLMVAFSNQDTKAVRSYAQQLVSHHSGMVYADTARLMQAKLEVTDGHAAKARQLLRDVAEHTAFPVLADIARLRLARVLAYEQSYTEALQTLDKVSHANYAAICAELRGDIYHAMGKFQQALDAYQTAKTDIEQSGVGNVFLEMKQHDLLALIQSAQAERVA